jgi:hypothetical protein
MGASQARRERRLALQNSNVPATLSSNITFSTGGGYGDGNKISRPASGNTPGVNPFMMPKQSGLNVISQMFPDNYWVEWDLSTWRTACDQAQKMGYPISYAALVSWAFEASPFIQSLFVEIGDGLISSFPWYLKDKKGNINEVWTEEICNKKWFKDLRKEMAWSDMWGFSGLNIDPLNNKIYKYPMQQIDPINRMLRQSTYNFTDGSDFAKTPNLLFIQPSTSYERFLGKMQPITRSFIQMNQTSINWVQAGRRLAFPLLTIGYPAANNSITEDSQVRNPMRDEAENYISTLDPSKSLVTPYILDKEGKPISALQMDAKDSSAKVNAHKIFQEFNADEKNEIRELIFGGVLTSTTGKNGSRSNGDNHMDKLKAALNSRNEESLDVANDETDFLWKLKKFYPNFPVDQLRFDTNRTKEYKLEDIKLLADSASENGLQLTQKFFIKFGLDPEDIQEAPSPVKPKNNFDDEDSTLSVSIAKPKRSVFDALKKKDIY